MSQLTHCFDQIDENLSLYGLRQLYQAERGLLMTVLKGKHVVLGVSGSIAAYKAADLTSKLVQAGAVVDVIVTDAAREFVTPFTFRSLTGRPVYTNMFDPQTSAGEEHVALARRADIVIVAPATATTMARIAYGLADDMLALTVLATKAPVLIAPAMDSQMWEAAATQANVATLKVARHRVRRARCPDVSPAATSAPAAWPSPRRSSRPRSTSWRAAATSQADAS